MRGEGPTPEHEFRPVRTMLTEPTVQGQASEALVSPPSEYADRDNATAYYRDDRIDGPEILTPFAKPQGYDLNGIGGNMLPSSPYGTATGPGSRDTVPLGTHQGLELRGSDYGHEGDRGFRYKARLDRV